MNMTNEIPNKKLLEGIYIYIYKYTSSRKIWSQVNNNQSLSIMAHFKINLTNQNIGNITDNYCIYNIIPNFLITV